MTDLSLRPPPQAASTIHQFLRAHALPPLGEGVVVGLSGGIDSALCARLARDALGPDRVLGVLLPATAGDERLVAETVELARSLGIESRTVRLETVVGSLRAQLPEITDRVTRGNSIARIRMAVLYELARDRGGRVLGTGNKSELLLGYFTKFGDGGVDLLPIGDLYKTQVRELARELGLPRAVLDRAPSAGFWDGQTDEEELGIPYSDLDRILRGLELLWPESEIASAAHLDEGTVHAVAERVRAHRHKRRMPPVAKLSLRTVGLDWRE